MNRRPIPALTVLIALVALSACDGSVEEAAALPQETDLTTPETLGDTTGSPAVVTIARSRFETPELYVRAGTTVAFENTDEFAHTVTSVEGAPAAFGSDELGQGDTFTATFDEVGEYGYFCQIHPTMRGTVIVE